MEDGHRIFWLRSVLRPLAVTAGCSARATCSSGRERKTGSRSRPGPRSKPPRRCPSWARSHRGRRPGLRFAAHGREFLVGAAGRHPALARAPGDHFDPLAPASPGSRAPTATDCSGPPAPRAAAGAAAWAETSGGKTTGVSQFHVPAATPLDSGWPANQDVLPEVMSTDGHRV